MHGNGLTPPRPAAKWSCYDTRILDRHGRPSHRPRVKLPSPPICRKIAKTKLYITMNCSEALSAGRKSPKGHLSDDDDPADGSHGVRKNSRMSVETGPRDRYLKSGPKCPPGHRRLFRKRPSCRGVSRCRSPTPPAFTIGAIF